MFELRCILSSLARGRCESFSVVDDDLEHSDEVVGPSREQELAGGVPGQTGALNLSLLLLSSGAVLGLGFVPVESLVAWQVVHLDSNFGSNDEPVHLLGEQNAVDGGISFSL